MAKTFATAINCMDGRVQKPVTEYLKIQGRFRHLKEEEVRRMQENVDTAWDKLLKKEELS